jgi:ABC-2 type transport system ATP-binding protein
MIEASGLCKNFDDIEAVRDISFTVEEGEVVGLLGPNGAGKTTTMRMLTTFQPPSSGTASVAGFDILRDPVEVRKNIGYLPETPPLYPELRVREYLEFAARIKGVERKAVKSRVDDLLGLCGLESAASRVCGHLSRGYRQRVGIAQALVHNPKVIILDEPTSGLDPVQILEVRRLIAELREEHTVILSTHILQEVAETCSRVLIISQGRISLQGSLEDLVKDRSLEEAFLKAVAGDSTLALVQESAAVEGGANE